MSDRQISKILNRLAGMISRGVVTAIGDTGKTQTASVAIQDDDTANGVEHFQPGGLTHNAGAGAECLVFAVGGESANPVALAAGKRGQRPATATGETALYSTGDNQTVIKIFANGDVEITLGGTGTALKIAGNSLQAAIASLVQAELTAIKATLLTGSCAVAPGPVVFGTPYTGPAALGSQVLKMGS